MSLAHPQTGGTNREEQVNTAPPELIPRQYAMLSRGAERVWALGKGVHSRRNAGNKFCCVVLALEERNLCRSLRSSMDV